MFASFMQRTLIGVVSRTILILLALIVLGIGATPAEAVFASKQKNTSKHTDSPICGSNYSTLCSDTTYTCSKDNLFNKLDEKQLEVGVPSVSSVSFFASPTQPLNPSINTTITLSPAEVVTPTPASDASGGLNADKLFGMVNAKRQEAGLAPLEKDTTVCQVAQARAPQMQSDVASGNMHAGFYARKPSYQSTENMIYMNSEEQALNWWLNSPVHRGAIYGDYQDSCLVCQGNTCARIFANVTEATPTPVTP